MQEPIDPSDQLQLAALVFPIIALVVNFSINSVKEDDDWWYRLVVGSLGIGALAPSLVVLGLGVLGFWFNITTPSVFGYLGISLISMGMLTIIVLMVEIMRGLHEETDKSDALKVLAGLAGSIIVLAVILNQI